MEPALLGLGSSIASVVGTHLGYIALTFFPPLLWLFFYLREDAHAEPKLLLLLTFFGGMASVLFAIVAECAFVEVFTNASCQEGFGYSGNNMIVLFLGIAFIEEYVKYLAVKFLVLRRADFDEPVDAMIYLMTAALGFAAVENALFILPLLWHDQALMGLEVITNRFVGANLLHALTSGIVGFFLARAWFSKLRHHYLAIGLILATILHAIFNYLVLIEADVSEGTLYLFGLLTVMAIMVFIDFERLKGQGRGREEIKESV